MDEKTTQKLVDLSEHLEDVAYDADKLEDEQGKTPNETLEDLRSDVDAAKDVIDDLADGDN